MNVNDVRVPGADAEWRRLVERIDDLKRQLTDLSASVGKFGAKFTTHGIDIDGGHLAMSGTDGSPLLWIGDISSGTRGMLVTKPDGTNSAIFADDGVSILDGRGNDVLSTDRITGYGLSAPLSSWTMVERSESITATADAGVNLLWEVQGNLVYPRIRLSFTCYSSSGSYKIAVRITENELENPVSYSWNSDALTGNTGTSHYIRVDEIENAAPRKNVTLSVGLIESTATVQMFRPSVQLGGYGFDS